MDPIQNCNRLRNSFFSIKWNMNSFLYVVFIHHHFIFCSGSLWIHDKEYVEGYFVHNVNPTKTNDSVARNVWENGWLLNKTWSMASFVTLCREIWAYWDFEMTWIKWNMRQNRESTISLTHIHFPWTYLDIAEMQVLCDKLQKTKRRRSDPVLWQKPLHQHENFQKGKVTTQTIRHKKVRLNSNCGPT